MPWMSTASTASAAGVSQLARMRQRAAMPPPTMLLHTMAASTTSTRFTIKKSRMLFSGATAGGSGSIYPSGIPSFPAKGTTLRETVR